MQRLLHQANWDADRIRDDVRDLVVHTLGRRDGVLILTYTKSTLEAAFEIVRAVARDLSNDEQEI